MSDPVGRPSHIPCGRCRALTALKWAPIGDDYWAGSGQCPSCGAGVFSLSSELGIPLDYIGGLLSDFFNDDLALVEVVFRGPESPKKGGSATLIA